MPLPRAVEEAEARANELMKGQQEHRQPAPEANRQEPPPPAPVVAASGEDPPIPAMPDVDDGLEHKYRVLQGKYRAEVVEVNSRNRELRAENEQLRHEVEKLKAQPAPAASVADVISDLVTPEEREQYGDDFVNFLTRVSTRAAGANKQSPGFDMSTLEQRLKPMEESTLATAKRLFFNDLTSKASSWRTLNKDTGFLAWLTEVDQFTGQSRQTLFDDAYHKLDVERVASFFNSYSGQSVGAAQTELPSLEEQVVPNTGSQSPPPPPGKRLWNQQQVAAFYDELRRGVHTPEQAAVIEQDIFAAQRDGRFRMGRPR